MRVSRYSLLFYIHFVRLTYASEERMEEGRALLRAGSGPVREIGAFVERVCCVGKIK